jgi:hypothetical protein
MEQHALVAVSDPEKRDDVGRVEAFDVTEHDDLALLVGQCRQEVVDSRGEVLGDEPVIDLIGPGNGRLRPRAVDIKSFDGPAIGTAGALLTARAGASTVEQHPEQPCLERRPALESVNAADDGEPSVLAHFLRDRATTHGCLGETEQPRLVAADQLDERGLLAGAQPFDKSEVIIHAGRGYDDLVAGEG